MLTKARALHQNPGKGCRYRMAVMARPHPSSLQDQTFRASDQLGRTGEGKFPISSLHWNQCGPSYNTPPVQPLIPHPSPVWPGESYLTSLRFPVFICFEGFMK